MDSSICQVLFLDFDGVLNSEASFRMEKRRGTKGISHTLSEVACSNLQHLLSECRHLKIIVSSTWRLLHTMDELKAILYHYGVDQTRIVDVTPQTLSRHRGREIGLWLEDNPQVERYVVLDDDGDIRSLEGDVKGLLIQTSWEDGLLMQHVNQAIRFIKNGESRCFVYHDPASLDMIIRFRA